MLVGALLAFQGQAITQQAGTKRASNAAQRLAVKNYNTLSVVQMKLLIFFTTCPARVFTVCYVCRSSVRQRQVRRPPPP